MTIEEKAKAYDKAIEKMKSKLKDFKEIIISRSDIEEIFPNLQESEDERIRKGMLQGFKDYEEPEYEWWNGVKVKECIAWLEKQGQLKKVSIWKHWKDGIAGNGDGIPVFLIKNGLTYSLSSCLGFECDYIELSELDNLMLEQQENPTEINPSEFDLRLNRLLKQFESLPKEELKSSLSFYLNVIQNDGTYKEEKQGEQETLCNKCRKEQPSHSCQDITALGRCAVEHEHKSANKVERKFKVDDFIVNDYCKGKVVELTTDAYLLDTGQGIPFSCEHNAHLWSINDARDGDILATEPIDSYPSPFVAIYKSRGLDFFNSYCFIGFDGKLYKGDTGHSLDEIHPATEVQCNILFSKIKESGYEWNVEKKELSKIHVIDEGKDEMDSCFTKMMNGEKVNSAWSKEDERLCQCLIRDQEKALDEVRNDKYGHSEIISDLKEMYRKRIDWLESLRQRFKQTIEE